MTNHTINWRDTTHLDSEDNYQTGCRNVSHCQQQQFYSGLRSPGRSNSTLFSFIHSCQFAFFEGEGRGGGGGYNKVIMFPLNELENGRTFSGKFIAFTKEVAIGRNSKNR